MGIMISKFLGGFLPTDNLYWLVFVFLSQLTCSLDRASILFLSLNTIDILGQVTGGLSYAL